MKFKNTDTEIYFLNPKDSSFGNLSSYADTPFVLEGIKWKTFEHYYQATKFIGRGTYTRILKCSTPLEAAKIGNNPRFKPNEGWDDSRDNLMYQGLMAKFLQNSSCAEQLMNTEEKSLYYVSPHDSYLGTGKDGKGENKLGKMLVDIRNKLHTFEKRFATEFKKKAAENGFEVQGDIEGTISNQTFQADPNNMPQPYWEVVEDDD